MAFSNFLPGVYQQISNGNLGQISNNVQQVCMKVGVCTNYLGGVQAFGSQTVMQNTLGDGALVANLALQLAVDGGPVLCLPIAWSLPGSIGGITHSGTSSAIVDAYGGPHESILIYIKSTGILGAGTFEYNVNLDGYSAPVVIPVGGVYNVPGTFVALTFASGTYTAGDTYVVGVNGIVTKSDSGAPNISIDEASPLRNYYVLQTITTGGGAGVGQFTISLDNGNSTSPPIVYPSGGTYVIPGTGIYLEMSGTLVAGDTYSFLTCGPSFSNTDLTNALASIPINVQFSMLEVVREAMLASAAAAATEANTVATALASRFNGGDAVRGIISCPIVNGSSVTAAQAGLSLGSVSTQTGSLVVDSADTDSVIAAAFAGFVNARVSIAVGDVLDIDPLTGLNLRRPCSWDESARLVGIIPSVDGAEVGTSNGAGPLPTIQLLFRDEALTPALDISSGQRFTTTRTISGAPGFFFTNVLTMDSVGGDYEYMTDARVVDEACFLGRQWALPLINSRVQTTSNPNAVPGSISAAAAALLNASLTSFLNNEMVPGDAVAVKAQVDTTHNIVADRILPITIQVQPYGYAGFIDQTIGLAVQV